MDWSWDPPEADCCWTPKLNIKVIKWLKQKKCCLDNLTPNLVCGLVMGSPRSRLFFEVKWSLWLKQKEGCPSNNLRTRSISPGHLCFSTHHFSFPPLFPAFLHHQANPPPQCQYLSSMQHQSPAFYRKQSEPTDRNVALKPTALFRTTPNSLEIVITSLLSVYS